MAIKIARVIEYVINIVGTVTGFFMNPVIKFVFGLIYNGSAQTVSPIKDDLLLQSAVTLARKIRRREVKAVEVMDTFISRVKKVNPVTNCVVADRFDAAIKEAEEVDRLLDSDSIDETFSEQNKPFLGVPFSIKEAFGVKGMPNTSGLVSRKGSLANFDAPVITRMRQAGCIPYIMTNVSELCMWYESANRLYGRTKNPYNTGRIVGGSSGGEGCSIASGAAVFGIGSDIGGSIRMPAFFNGIFGHRPSRDVVPNEGQFPMATGTEVELLCSGPMCRYAEDLLPALRVMAGSNCSKLDLDKKVDLKSLRFYTMEDDGGGVLISSVDPQLKKAQRDVVNYLQQTVGVTVTPVKIRRMKYSLDFWSTKMATSGGIDFVDYMGNLKGPINPFKEMLKWLVCQSNHTLPAILLGITEKLSFVLVGSNERVEQAFEKLEEEIRDLLNDDGILLYPSHPLLAPYHNQPLLYPFNFAYTAIFNALGLPVTQCPLGLSKEGLPLGLQVVAAMYNDHLSLAVARELEKGFGGWTPPGTI